MKKPTSNPALNFVRPDWKGNPLTAKGNYRNLYARSERNFSDIFKWKLKGNPQAKEKSKAKNNVIVQPLDKLPKKKQEGLVWLGHACFLLQLEGIRILTDPVFGNASLVPRILPFPIKPKALKKIDLLLLSHGHYDHLDKSSVQKLCKKNPEMRILCGLEMKKLLQKWVGKKQFIQEAGWYQQYQTGFPIDINFLPAMHWTRRGINDLNAMLWGSFHLSSSKHRIFFGGDSGYDKHFKDIAETHQTDIALLGIGAYEPNWFMKSSHTNPEDAYTAFSDLKAKTFIPMHYGVYDLSDEPIDEPLNRFRKLQAKESQILKAPAVGEWIPLH